MNFDEILEVIGDFGAYQRTIYIISSLASILVGIHMLSNVFTMASPKARCFISGCDNFFSEYSEPWLPYTAPASETQGYNECLQFEALKLTNFTCAAESFGNTTKECGNNWIWNKEEFLSTTVTEWDLICSNSWIISTSQSIFMAGVLVGSISFGAISDKFGRRMVFFIAPALLVFSSVGTAFSNSWIIYTILKFLTAVAINGVFQTGFVVVVEFIGISKRAWCGNMIQVFFAIGELVLAVTAYLIRDWRKLQLVISIPLGFLLFYPCLVPESVRWLLGHGRIVEAKAIINKIANKNRKPISNDSLDEFLETTSSSSIITTQRKSTCFDLFRSSIMFRRSLNIFFNWTVNSLVYYGLSMSASNLSGNTYFNFIALAAVEIPGVILATFMQQWKGRRAVLCTVMLLGGLACIGSALTQKVGWLSTSLAVLGKSNIAASFAVIYIYSAEIFPTPLRNTAIGISSTFSRIGGILAPVIADLGAIHAGLPMYIFGGFSVTAGLLSLALPETHNRKLPETIEEAESFGRSDKHRAHHEDDDYSRAPLLSENTN